MFGRVSLFTHKTYNIYIINFKIANNKIKQVKLFALSDSQNVLAVFTRDNPDIRFELFHSTVKVFTNCQVKRGIIIYAERGTREMASESFFGPTRLGLFRMNKKIPKIKMMAKSNAVSLILIWNILFTFKNIYFNFYLKFSSKKATLKPWKLKNYVAYFCSKFFLILFESRVSFFTKLNISFWKDLEK